jgi:phosphoglycolate phosphatase
MIDVSYNKFYIVNMNKPSVLLDFDGTIIDSTDALLDALGTLSNQRFTIDKQSRAQLRRQGWKQFLLSLNLQETQLPRVVETICNEVAETIGRMKLVEGMADVLLSLREQSQVLGIVTSNSERNVRRILGEELMKLFDLVHAGGISNKGDVLQRIVRDNALIDSTYYVGDEVRDIEAAKFANAKSVGVTWGVSDTDTLRSAQPDYLIHHPHEVIDIIAMR